MKTRGGRMLLLGALMSGWLTGTAQSYVDSEVPGDNFSLEGALELFKRSTNPEEFERQLNSPDSKVNNLDLNNDHYIDYIRVIDRTRGNVHAFVLQAVLSEDESQDVAVIELEKLNNGKAVLQITGDADVYGIETIIEPTEEVRTYAGTTTSRTVVNVWTWPSVQYVYSPYYDVWVSPWQWAYQPVWWRPWRTVTFNMYVGWWQPYRSYYTSCHSHRVYYAPEIYRPHRTTSVIVVNNYGDQINYYRTKNSYRYERDRNGDGYGNNHGNNGNHGGNNGNHGNGNNGNGNGNSGYKDGHRANGFPRYNSDREKYPTGKPKQDNGNHGSNGQGKKDWNRSDKFANQQVTRLERNNERPSGFRPAQPQQQTRFNGQDIRSQNRPAPAQGQQRSQFNNSTPQRFSNSQGSGKPAVQRQSSQKPSFQKPSQGNGGSSGGGNNSKPSHGGGQSRGRH
jgi:hypothetical protein